MTENPWDIPPLPQKGDDAHSMTFEAVGRATSEWEHLEAYLGLAFAVFVGATNTVDAAMRAYGSIVAFKGRSGMLQAAAEVFFNDFPSDSLQDRFNKLDKAAGRFSGRRNEIAHGIVQPYYAINGEAHVGAALVPSYFATNKRLLESVDGDEYSSRLTLKYAYTSVEITNFSEQFAKLAKEALELYKALSGHRAAEVRRKHASKLARLLVEPPPQSSETEGPNLKDQPE
ncbi:MAG: hypothetical protein EOP50_21820 [Sphingobacteriales bacterium]|nr:MAG: hypothetical protein EOP50_21820 [Sphingobacteriales bacterium]